MGGGASTARASSVQRLQGTQVQKQAHRKKRAVAAEAYHRVTEQWPAWLDGSDAIPEPYPPGTIAPVIYRWPSRAAVPASAALHAEAIP